MIIILQIANDKHKIVEEDRIQLMSSQKITPNVKFSQMFSLTTLMSVTYIGFHRDQPKFPAVTGFII